VKIDVDAAMAEGYTIPEIVMDEGIDPSTYDWQGALDAGHLPSDIVADMRVWSMTETVSTPSLGMPGLETAYPDMKASPGDTPQLDASGVVAESLPLIFSAVGGKAIGPAGAGAGAAGGVMARDALYNMWGAEERGGQFDPKEMLETGAMFAGVDAAVGLAGRGVIGIAEREGIKTLPKALLIDPFGKETAKRTVAMMEYVKANNLPVNATNYLTGPVTKTMAFVTDLLPGGSSAAQRARGTLHKRLIDVASKEMVEWGDEVVPEGVILEAATEAMKKTSDALKKGGKEAGFEEIKSVLKTQSDGYVPVTRTREAVLAALKEVKADKTTAKKFKKSIDFLEDRFVGQLIKGKDGVYYLKSESLVDIYGGIWETMAKTQMKTRGGKLIGGGLKDGVTSDLNTFGATLEEAVAFGSKLREADDVFKIGKALANTNATTKRLVKSGQTRNAIKSILGNEDPVVVRQMLDAMEGAGHGEAVELIKKQYLYNMAQGAVKHSESGEAKFLVSKFLDDWGKTKGRVVEIFGDETFKKWDEFAGWLTQNLDDIVAVQKPNKVADMLGSVGRYAAASAVAAKGYAAGGPAGAAAAITVPNGFAYMLASLMHNPKAISFVAQGVPLVAENIAAPAIKGGLTVSSMNKRKKKSYNPADMLTP